MPETYGLPEPEPTPEERFAGAIAGQGIVRRVVLYVALITTVITVTAVAGPAGIPLGVIASVAVVLLMASDGGLS